MPLIHALDDRLLVWYPRHRKEGSDGRHAAVPARRRNVGSDGAADGTALHLSDQDVLDNEGENCGSPSQ